MSKTIPFVPTSFPVFGEDWVSHIQPFVEAYARLHHSYVAQGGDQRYQRKGHHYRHVALLREETRHEMAEAQAELDVRQCLRELAETAPSLGLSTSQLTRVLAVVVSQTIRNTSLWDAIDHHLDQKIEPSPEEVQEMREAIRAAIRECRQPDHAAGYDWLDQRIKRARFAEIVPLLYSVMDMELLEQVCRDGADSPEVSDQKLDEISAHVSSLKSEYYRLDKNFQALNARTERITDHLLAPYVDAYSAHLSYGLPPILCLIKSEEITHVLAGADHKHKIHDSVKEEHGDTLLLNASLDPMFWYITLTSGLQTCSAMFGGQLRESAVELLANLIKHPARIKRIPVPPEAMKTQAWLGKWFAPLLKGFHPHDEIADVILELGRNQPAQALMLLSNLLCNVGVGSDETLVFRNREHRKTVTHFWDNLIGPAHQEIMHWMRANMEGVDELLATHTTIDPDTEQPSETVDQEWYREFQVEGDEVDPVEPAPREFVYVPNPAAADLKLIPLPLPPESREDAFAAFLRAKNVKAVIKPISLLNALDFFTDMPEVIRATSPYEDVGGHRWHKLKRGAQRIYVRMDESGRILFHPYARKDWRKDLVTFSGHAA